MTPRWASDWAAVKLVPSQTGLPLAVWITENDGYPHDVRVKVDGSWAALGVRPTPHEIVAGSLPAADVALVRRWIEVFEFGYETHGSGWRHPKLLPEFKK